jgi:hypothetical protein
MVCFFLAYRNIGVFVVRKFSALSKNNSEDIKVFAVEAK